MQKTVSCVTGAVLKPSKNGYQRSEKPHVLTFPDDPIALGSEENLALSVRHDYGIVRGEGLYGRWKVKTTAYYYELQSRSGAEVLSYHWHPESRSPATFPHMHIGTGSGVEVGGLLKAHFPTPRMALEDFLRMLIEDFGVQCEREDWENVLGRSRAKFEADRTWRYIPTEREEVAGQYRDVQDSVLKLLAALVALQLRYSPLVLGRLRHVSSLVVGE
jgi:hypothetical protein